MPQSNSFDTGPIGSAVGNPEELTRKAYITSNENTPVWSYLPKMITGSMEPEYVLDDRKEVSATPIAEGKDHTDAEDKFKYQYRTSNYVNILEETAAVTDVQELVDNVTGVSINNALKIAIEDLNLKSEANILGTQAKSLTGTVRQCAGIAEQLSGSSSLLIDRYQTPAAQRPTNQDPTLANVDNVLRSMFDNSGKKAIVKIFAGSAWTAKFASKTAQLTSTENFKAVAHFDGGKGYYPSFVRRYEGQHGVTEVHDLNYRTCPDPTNKDMAYFMQDGGAHIKTLKTLKITKPEDRGGGPSVGIKRYQTVCVTKPRELGYWDGLAS